MEIEEYVIVASHTEYGLSKDVTSYLQKGWKLYGQPFVANFDSSVGTKYAQAVIKQDEYLGHPR